ncbi:MAG: hypothetical protein EBY29_13305, partial [Planctomycetes bacterium]|nr:hypothetical protein [Planctomycetota bacterium]
TTTTTTTSMSSTVIPSKFHIIYWYGERFYSADQVDAELHRRSQELKCAVSKSNTASEYWTAVANASTIALQLCNTVSNHRSELIPEEPELPEENSSPRSSCSSNAHSNNGCSIRGRATGKRNQEFYIPHDVLLSHTVVADYDCDNDGNNVSREWIGRYDKSSNTIIRFADKDDDTSPQMAYETLKHFAQEHDREICNKRYNGLREYRECSTTNVWTNPLFKFYNTVTLNWEPLGTLRNNTAAN